MRYLGSRVRRYFDDIGFHTSELIFVEDDQHQRWVFRWVPDAYDETKRLSLEKLTKYPPAYSVDQMEDLLSPEEIAHELEDPQGSAMYEDENGIVWWLDNETWYFSDRVISFEDWEVYKRHPETFFALLVLE